jgi:enoyl-CoA hydratase/carnithine racemase
MDLKTVQTVELTGGIAILTLNRPERRNAISVEMRREIIACLRKWKDSQTVGVLIITGSGEAFSAGFDLTEFRHSELFSEVFETSSQYHRDLWYFPKPTIAAVNGPALAGGFDLAKLCDIRIGSPQAVFGHPEIKFGIPPLVTPLRWIIGEGLARHLCLTGRRVDAMEACRIGLISEVVEGEKLLERAVKIATEIMETPLEALRMTKQLMIECSGRGFEESFCQEHDRVFQGYLLKKASESMKSK